MSHEIKVAAQSAEFQRGYKLGYARSVYRRELWPPHRPPMPPVGVVADMMSAARELRDIMDNYCAMLSPDDEWAMEAGPAIDRLDAANVALTKWLRDNPEPGAEPDGRGVGV